MSNKRTAAARKATLRDRRRATVTEARETWTDQGFGIKIGTGRADRMVMSWTVDHDPFLALMGLERFRSGLDALEVELVTRCRYQQGQSWDEIGWSLGVSGEAVRKRLTAAVEASAIDQGWA